MLHQPDAAAANQDLRFLEISPSVRISMRNQHRIREPRAPLKMQPSPGLTSCKSSPLLAPFAVLTGNPGAGASELCAGTEPSRCRPGSYGGSVGQRERDLPAALVVWGAEGNRDACWH